MEIFAQFLLLSNWPSKAIAIFQVNMPLLHEGEPHITKRLIDNCRTGTKKKARERGKKEVLFNPAYCIISFLFPGSSPTFYPSIVITKTILSFCFILLSKFLPVIQRVTFQEKFKKAVLVHCAWCHVLGLICNFHRVAKHIDYSSAKSNFHSKAYRN